MTARRAPSPADAHATTRADAITAAARDPHQIGRDDDAMRRIGSFVELHVEQGRGLIDLDHPVAVGSDIWPHGRWRMDFTGEANHAGTTRLEDRHDAMLGYAAAVLAAREAATRHGCVATVGKVHVVPGGVNAIPSAVTGWLDARGASPRAVRRAVADITAMVEQSGGRITEESWTPSTPFDSSLSARLGTRLGGIPVLGTGAGHDAGILANAGIPTAMLFVRNPTGISHSPEEHAELSDCLEGVAALTAVLEDLAGAQP